MLRWSDIQRLTKRIGRQSLALAAIIAATSVLCLLNMCRVRLLQVQAVLGGEAAGVGGRGAIVLRQGG